MNIQLQPGARMKQPIQSQAPQPLIYRINVAVQQMGISRATLYRMVKAGDLELVKISIRASGITRESINRHLKTGTHNS